MATVGIQVSLLWADLGSLMCISMSSKAGSHGNLRCRCWRDLHADLHSQQHSRQNKCFFFPEPCPVLTCFCFLEDSHSDLSNFNLICISMLAIIICLLAIYNSFEDYIPHSCLHLLLNYFLCCLSLEVLLYFQHQFLITIRNCGEDFLPSCCCLFTLATISFVAQNFCFCPIWFLLFLLSSCIPA